jgi:hypothetical protein
MTFKKNEFGVVQYPDDDIRRLFVLLSALELLERPTLAAVADLTNLNPETVDDDIERLQDQFGVQIHKLGNVYRIESWGDILKKNGVLKRLKSVD